MTEKILLNVIDEIAQAQKIITGGEDKKIYVMNKLKEYTDDYKKYEPMISLIIDFIKTLSKNKKLLDTIKNKMAHLVCLTACPTTSICLFLIEA